MKSQFVSDLLKLDVGDQFRNPFRLSNVERREKTNGSAYIALFIVDRTGSIQAKWWDCSEADCSSALRYRYAYVEGRIRDYQGRKEVHLSGPPEWLEEPADLTHYELMAALPLSELCHRLDIHVSSVRHPHLKALLERIFGDAKFRRCFDEAPAAQKMHHACRHGLLQHTVEVTDLASRMAETQAAWGYASVSRDLVVAGALLHDIGKVDELTLGEQGEYGPNRRGMLLGHISIGIQRVNAGMNALPGFPTALKETVLHMVASHHGKKEFGSPVVPMFPEAQIVHAADLLDVQMFYMHEAARDAVEDFVSVRKLDGQRIFTRLSEILGDIPNVLEGAMASEASHFHATPVLLQTDCPAVSGATLPRLRFRLAGSPDISSLSFHTRRVPLTGQAAAGSPITAEEHVEDYYDVEGEKLPHTADLYLLRVKGDSMSGDDIHDGDLILIMGQEHHSPEEIVVALLLEQDEVVIKRVRAVEEGLQLVSSNPAFTPIAVANPDSLLIRGKVLAVLGENWDQ